MQNLLQINMRNYPKLHLHRLSIPDQSLWINYKPPERCCPAAYYQASKSPHWPPSHPHSPVNALLWLFLHQHYCCSFNKFQILNAQNCENAKNFYLFVKARRRFFLTLHLFGDVGNKLGGSNSFPFLSSFNGSTNFLSTYLA